MKPNEEKWRIIHKSNGKYYPKFFTEHLSPCWPWRPNEFDTLEEAKQAILAKQAYFAELAKNNKETIVWES